MLIKTIECGQYMCPFPEKEARALESRQMCIGAKCMAYRLADEHSHGYCGLAGKPSEVVITECVAMASYMRDAVKGGAK